MSGIMKNALRPSVLKTANNAFRQSTVLADNIKSQFVRNVWHMSAQLDKGQRLHHFTNTSVTCNCGCGGVARVHTKGDPTDVQSPLNSSQTNKILGEQELADFLNEEIVAEKKLQKVKTIPSEIDGFKISLDISEVTLSKKNGDEIVEVNFNINHSVDSEVNPEVDPSMDKPEMGEMKSKPNFEVEIRRGGKTLGFTCSIVDPGASNESDQGYNDIFSIDEVVMYEGEWKDNNYSVAGDVLDGTLYDLLMNLLEDKGITNEFVEKVVEFSTFYEHSKYINLLENVQRFCLGK